MKTKILIAIAYILILNITADSGSSSGFFQVGGENKTKSEINFPL